LVAGGGASVVCAALAAISAAPASDADDTCAVASAGAPGGSDKDDEGGAADVVNAADAVAGFTAVRAGLLRARDEATRDGTEGFDGFVGFVEIAGATIVPATEGAGAAGRRRLGVSGDQRAAAARVRTKPAA
jgi:hypothetical protein